MAKSPKGVCGVTMGETRFNVVVFLPKHGLVEDTPSHTNDRIITGLDGPFRDTHIETCIHRLAQVRALKPYIIGIVFTKKYCVFLHQDGNAFYCRDDKMRLIDKSTPYTFECAGADVVEIVINTLKVR
jgi:hypothetical protein